MESFLGLLFLLFFLLLLLFLSSLLLILCFVLPPLVPTTTLIPIFLFWILVTMLSPALFLPLYFFLSLLSTILRPEKIISLVLSSPFPPFPLLPFSLPPLLFPTKIHFCILGTIPQVVETQKSILSYVDFSQNSLNGVWLLCFPCYLNI